MGTAQRYIAHWVHWPRRPRITSAVEPFPARTARKRRKIGPFSRRLSFGSLDLRTKEGQFAHDIKTALLEQLGGDPTPAQQILVQLAAIKALRCELLCNVIFSDTAIKDVREYHLLAWMNGLRRDLEALGLEEPEPAKPMDAITLARLKYDRPATGEPA
jgi:hypothetical protein